MAGRPEGFEWTERGDEVRITHHGKPATVLRGGAAARFLEEIPDPPDSIDAQELMARLTGNYRRGNERTAKQHPRNQRR